MTFDYERGIKMKKTFSHELLIYPCPIVLITSKYKNIENVLAVSWAGVASSHPEYVTISIKKSRFSHTLIMKSKVFTINMINKELLKKADYCGTYSAKSVNKFEKCGFTQLAGKHINVPMIKECPINIECSVCQTLELGSHTLIIGKVIGKFIDSNIYIDKLYESLDPVVYFRPNYYSINKTLLGTYGKMNEVIANNEEIF